MQINYFEYALILAIILNVPVTNRRFQVTERDADFAELQEPLPPATTIKTTHYFRMHFFCIGNLLSRSFISNDNDWAEESEREINSLIRSVAFQ